MAKPLDNSKFQEISKSYKSNQVKSPNGWNKRQCAYFNNKDKIRIHEARYQSIAVHFPYQFPDKKM